MAESAQEALYGAVSAALAADAPTVALVGTRIFPDLAPAKILVNGVLTPTPRPYIVYYWVAGGEINQSITGDALLTLIIKGVALTLASAFAIAAAIDVRLNDADISSALALNGGTYWEITNSSGGLVVHLPETVDGIQIYHSGKRYTFYMQAK